MERGAGLSRAVSTGPMPALLGVGRLPLEDQRGRVDAVALRRRVGGQASIIGTIVEDVTEVTPAAPANDLCAAHEQAVVRTQLDRLGDRGLRKARPSRARVELRVRPEQVAAAPGAAVGARLLVVDILAGERRLGAGAAQHLVLLRGQLLAPLLLGLLHPRVAHPSRSSSMANPFHARTRGACPAGQAPLTNPPQA